jgi:malonyl-CoA O-methyltransferase
MIGTGGVKKLIREYDEKFNTSQGVYAHWEIYYFSAVPRRSSSSEDLSNI